MDKPPFDPVKSSFYLIAAVLMFQCVIALIGVLSCVYFLHTIMTNPDIQCDQKDRLTSLLTGALAAALAFAGGFTRKDK